MSQFYVACELRAETGRVLLGTLHEEQLTISEVCAFENPLLQEEYSRHWNVPRLYAGVIEGLHGVGAYEEPVAGISCTSSGADYLLFERDGTLLTPTYHQTDPRTEAGGRKALAKVPWEVIHRETGSAHTPGCSLFQMCAETSRRLRRAGHLLPVADAFNYLLGGIPRVEMSLASTTLLYNPVTRDWSNRLFEALKLPSRLFPPVVPAGTELGPLRPEIAQATGLEGARVIASCSHEIAAALAGLPTSDGETWGFLRLGGTSVIGTQVARPLINEARRQLDFANEPGYGGAICFYKQTPGLWLLEECQRAWRQTDRGLDLDLLTHLAGSAMPFESLINPADPRFLEPGDMPQRIQAFCQETGQVVPRKPGPVYRCILESLALFFRKTLREVEDLAGSRMGRIFLLGGGTNSLLHHFTANALGVPVTIAPAEATAIGNIVVQALARGHLPSLEQARALVQHSFRTQTIHSHAKPWDAAYDRFLSIAKPAA